MASYSSSSRNKSFLLRIYGNRQMVSNHDARALYAPWFNPSRMLTSNRRVNRTLTMLLGPYIYWHTAGKYHGWLALNILTLLMDWIAVIPGQATLRAGRIRVRIIPPFSP
jgi:hypothetical protein